MIRKILLAAALSILGSIMIFGMWTLTTVPAWPAEKNRVEYIENSFESFKDKFFEEAKVNFIPGLVTYYYLADETEPKTTSYYLIVYGTSNRISLISARKEIKLNDDLVEVWEEIIYVVDPGTPFQYGISHKTIDQNDSCKEKDKEPLIEVWDEIIEKLVFNKEDRVQYIKDSFNLVGENFFIKAERIIEGSGISYFCKKETDPRTTSYYLTISTDAYVPMYIISIIARKEIELGDGLVEWYQEGIFLDQDTNKYFHVIDHALMDRSANCGASKLDKAKVWDNVIANLF